MYSDRYKVVLHRLVAIAFIPNPLNKKQVDHIDGDRSNNKATNLRWCTNDENQEYRIQQGNSGEFAYNTPTKVKYDGIVYDSLHSLAKHISNIRECKHDTVRKTLQRIKYGVNKIYGKEIIILG